MKACIEKAAEAWGGQYLKKLQEISDLTELCRLVSNITVTSVGACATLVSLQDVTRMKELACKILKQLPKAE